MKAVILMLISIFIVGCSTHLTRTSNSLDAGMSKKEVIAKMGIPDRRSMRGNNEALQYQEIVGFGQCSYITVWLTSSQVVGVNVRSGASIAGCGLGSENVDWDQMPQTSKVQ